MLCDVKIFLFMYDKVHGAKLLHYQSDIEDDHVTHLVKDCCNPTKNFFTNTNYPQLLKKAARNSSKQTEESE